MAVNLDPIELCDGEIVSKVVLHESANEVAKMRGRRDSARRVAGGVTVCFTPQDESGRVEHAECPLLDLSASGLGLIYDKPVDVDRACQIAYQTASHRLVRLHARVKRCTRISEHRYELGLRFTHRITAEQQLIVKRRPGRDITIGSRIRQLIDDEKLTPRGSGGGYAGRADPDARAASGDGEPVDLRVF